MFTGIIETLGEVKTATPMADGRELSIATPFAAELTLGESVAVNGACLTVVGRDSATCRFQAGFETWDWRGDVHRWRDVDWNSNAGPHRHGRADDIFAGSRNAQHHCELCG